MKFMAKEFLEATGAQQLKEGAKTICRGISTDTRTVQQGELFFALRGPTFDGHNFLKDAIQREAWGVVIQDPCLAGRQNPKSCWIFQVEDTLKALGDIARRWRSQFDIPCVAITGSNGKTTTKEMTAAILSQRWRLLKTEGNFNNLIGLPLTLNRLEAAHEMLILEMGMNAPGEIARLTQIAAPTVGLVTNAAPAHLEKLHTVEAVAQAKAELYETMPPEGTAIYNEEDVWMKRRVKDFKGRKISFGMGSSADIRFEHMECVGFDSMELKLRVQEKLLTAQVKTTGVHNVMNAMAACAAAFSLNLPLEAMGEGLKNFVPLKMRFEQTQLQNGVRLINDAYNANPLSMEQALQTVRHQKRAGRLIAVFGDMKELGEASAVLHQELGKKAMNCGVEKLFLVGEFASAVAEGAKGAGMSHSQIVIAPHLEALTQAVALAIQAGDVVLVKASRAMRLEEVAEELKERFGE